MFTKLAREIANPYWEGSFTHPFITKLADGTLSDEVFRYYLIQDRYYLEHFSRIHEMIAARTTDPDIRDIMLMGAEHLDAGELMIRTDFFHELGITDEEVANTPIAPTAYNYVSHMYRQLAEGTINTAVAGLLPCPWLYHEIGLRLVKTGSPKKIYQDWIETYSGDDSAEDIVKQCQVLDRLYAESSELEQEAMLDAFYISSQMEYLFWEMATTLQTWPLGTRK
ncbi:thiaminase II [Vagococcus penaei]|uniref:Aminopyrimidine aminohydrolase n=1 Tax=Vagococcus penaei TaxID=633807 RepID=A0A1Q2D342_9ENTE|nr:thiaminase II [Vagococcus penaei]AQP52769.1 thiaminase II [Vagococcus penaei]RST98457.1 thiaminase II [Vagococcus penaei]